MNEDKDARFKDDNDVPPQPPKPVSELPMVKPPFVPKRMIHSLKPRHREIIMRIVYHGHSKAQICRDLGFNSNHFKLICGSPIFKQELEKEMQERAKSERQSRLNRLADPSILVIEQLLTKGRAEFTVIDENGNEVVNTVRCTGRVLVDLVRDILDRTGHKPIERKIEVKADLGNSIIQAFETAAEDELENGRDPEGDAIEVEATDPSESAYSESTGDGGSLDPEVYSQEQTGEGDLEAHAAGATDVNRDQESPSPSSCSADLCWRCKLPHEECVCPHKDNPGVEYFD
jgi:hypothetical protein